MGNAAIATAALYDPRIASSFGRRRVFVSLEASTEPRAILAKLVETLSLPSTPMKSPLLRILEAFAAERPLAAVLDNVETVFETNADEAERLLNLITALNGLSLVVTIRGIPPAVPHAVQFDDLPKLNPGAAQQAFLALAGQAFVSDPDLPRLLDALDGHALSIHLVAAQAAGLPTLAGLRESWDDAHAEILRRPGKKESRLTSFRASLLLSLNKQDEINTTCAAIALPTRLSARRLGRRCGAATTWRPRNCEQSEGKCSCCLPASIATGRTEARPPAPDAHTPQGMCKA